MGIPVGIDPDLSQAQEITDLGQRFTTARYLSQVLARSVSQKYI
jgi:hypothetical protein